MTDVDTAPRALTEDEKVVELLRNAPGYLGHGKVYEFVELSEGRMLMYPTDRLSARDFTLPYPVPDKGLRAAAMTVCAKKYLSSRGIKTDLIAYGRGIDDYLPASIRGKRLIHERGMIVRKLDMIPYEIIIRGYVLGSMASAIEKARADGLGSVAFCGYTISTAARRGAKIKEPLVTPTTKEKTGHDMPVRFQEVEDEYPGLIDFGRKVFMLLSERLASQEESEKLGIRKGCLLDMKIEVARDPKTGEYVLCDEISADSCRFCLKEDEHDLIKGKDVPFFDKEYWRKYLDGLGIDQLDPEDEEHRAIVASWVPDPEFLREFARRQDVACKLVTGGLSAQEYAAEARQR